MKIRILGIVICVLCYSVLSSAQDTSKALIMSQRAYDSTLRALKKAAEVKQKDTVRVSTDTVKISKDLPTVHDTAKPVFHDINKKAQSGNANTLIIGNDSAVKHNPDSKKNKVKYAPTGYVGLSLGESYPKGNFLSNGYPSKGGMFSFSAAFPGIISRFGLQFKVDYGWNGVDKVKYLDSLKSIVGNPNLGYSMPTNSFNYTYKTIVMGLYFSLPINNKFSIDARLLCGAMMATIPGLTINTLDYSNGNKITINTYETSGRAFALNEGISVKYIPIPQLSVMLSADNVSANPSFTLVGTGIAKDLNGYATKLAAQSETGNLVFHVLAISVGVGYTIQARK